MTDDRRAPRLATKIPILILNSLSRDNRFAVEVNSADISANGVKIVCPQMVRANAHLELLLMSGSKEEMRVFGKIMWVKKGDNATWEAGISFDIPNPEIIAKVQSYTPPSPDPGQKTA
ncbi:MAG: PilZ domain-containing protein [Candidatus Omnitrophica bacterium]|jgi:hypothetical protein|nr:PilZ domain-containing protein [Candidatus Omnitrophota bacterium]MDD5654784.1 PilZ domain-containing protein [Candidatus Omnitrophota bacterium]